VETIGHHVVVEMPALDHVLVRDVVVAEDQTAEVFTESQSNPTIISAWPEHPPAWVRRCTISLGMPPDHLALLDAGEGLPQIEEAVQRGAAFASFLAQQNLNP
jgi:hypothetical protein